MNGLYKIANLIHCDNKTKAEIFLNASHAIFEGHYPTHPVLPGACMLQIVKDTLELSIGRKLQLKNSTLIKFLSMVDPRETSTLNIDLNTVSVPDLVTARADLSANGKIIFKFQGSFVMV